MTKSAQTEIFYAASSGVKPWTEITSWNNFQETYSDHIISIILPQRKVSFCLINAQTQCWTAEVSGTTTDAKVARQAEIFLPHLVEGESGGVTCDVKWVTERDPHRKGL